MAEFLATVPDVRGPTRSPRRAGTTFRKLSEKEKEGITEKKAIALMLEQPSMIKRPVLELPGGKLLVGFRSEEYEKVF